MTPPAAAAAPRTRTRRPAPPARRVSGPVRGRAAGPTVAAPPPLALRLGGAVHGLAEHHFVDRLIRGRAWIAILAVGLMGIVFMQVSMLRMNAGIGASVEKASTLERQNSAMRAEISELSSVDRIGAEAAKIGLVLPQGTPRFLHTGSEDARRAVAVVGPPGVNVIASPTTTVDTPVDPASTTPVLGATGVAPATDTATAPAPEVAATTTTDPAATTATEPAATETTTPPATEDQAYAPAPTGETGGVDASGVVG